MGNDFSITWTGMSTSVNRYFLSAFNSTKRKWRANLNAQTNRKTKCRVAVPPSATFPLTTCITSPCWWYWNISLNNFCGAGSAGCTIGQEAPEVKSVLTKTHFLQAYFCAKTLVENLCNAEPRQPPRSRGRPGGGGITCFLFCLGWRQVGCWAGYEGGSLKESLQFMSVWGEVGGK